MPPSTLLHMAVVEPSYTASKQRSLVQSPCNADTFQSILPATCLLSPLPCLWALSKLFLGLFHQWKEQGAIDAALLLALHRPTSFRVWRKESWDPQRASAPATPFTCSAGGPQVSARLLGSAESLCSFVWSPVAFSACLFFWFGFLSCSSVSLSSLFVRCHVCFCR